MKINRTSVLGVGVMHDCITRGRAHFRILEDLSGSRTLYTYRPSDDGVEPAADEEFITIRLDEDEADMVANILHSTAIPDRVAELERVVTKLSGQEP